jgi:N6-L-threonylcarbamoyladenine synthase
MIILGIESTAHTFGVGIVKNGKILVNVRNMYTTETGGIIPVESAKHHKAIASQIYNEALEISKIKEKDIDAIAISNAPGLSPCLLEGLRFAKELALRLKKPLVPVNHCIAHLEIGRITGAKDPVMLYVSGANTQIIAYEAGKYRIFGETLDVGVGNFIDNFARFLGLGFPGGPKIEELAKKGNKYIELPYKVKGMDIALSGILTNLKQKLEKKENTKEDIAFSMQETVFAMLVETAERALAHTGKKELLLAGGVACNSRLQEMCRIMCEERGCKLFVPSRDLLVDNGAMIAYAGEIMFKSGVKEKVENVDIMPRQRTDDVVVRWRS